MRFQLCVCVGGGGGLCDWTHAPSVKLVCLGDDLYLHFSTLVKGDVVFMSLPRVIHC